MIPSKKLIFFVYVIVLILLIILPINSNDSKLNHTYIFKLRADYLTHAFVFLPWCLLNPEKSITIHPYLWLALGLICACSLELVQFFIPFRTFNINDMVGNSSGVTLGYLIKEFVRLRK